MNLTEQQTTIINDLLSERADLKSNLDDNINHVARIRRAMDKEKDQDKYWALFDKAKAGEKLISDQTREFNLLSIQKISSRSKVNYSTVKTHEAMLSGERDVRISLGIA